MSSKLSMLLHVRELSRYRASDGRRKETEREREKKERQRETEV